MKKATIVYLTEEEITLTDQKKGSYSRSDYIRKALLLQLYKSDIKEVESPWNWPTLDIPNQPIPKKEKEVETEEDVEDFRRALTKMTKEDDEFKFEED